MAAGLRVGVNQALFHNSGTYGTPTWGEVTLAKNVKLSLQKSMAEMKTRASTWISNLPAMKSVAIEFDLLADTSVAIFNTLRDAWINDTLVDLAVCDDAAIATSGADYFRAQCYLRTFDVDQQLEEGETISVTADLAYTSNAPAWVDVT